METDKTKRPATKPTKAQADEWKAHKSALARDMKAAEKAYTSGSPDLATAALNRAETTLHAMTMQIARGYGNAQPAPQPTPQPAPQPRRTPSGAPSVSLSPFAVWTRDEGESHLAPQYYAATMEDARRKLEYIHSDPRMLEAEIRDRKTGQRVSERLTRSARGADVTRTEGPAPAPTSQRFTVHAREFGNPRARRMDDFGVTPVHQEDGFPQADDALEFAQVLAEEDTNREAVSVRLNGRTMFEYTRKRKGDAEFSFREAR